MAIAVTTLIAAMSLDMPAAHSASPDDITWSVTPANASGADHRGVT